MVYSKEIRAKKFLRFVELKAKMETKKRIMNTLGINYNTFEDWCRRLNNKEEFLIGKRRTGTKRKTTQEDDNTLKDLALNNQWKTLNELKQLPQMLSNTRLSSVSDNTLRSRLKEKGVRRRLAAIKTLLRQQHKDRRLRYATDFIHWTLEDWASTIFIDEFSCETGFQGKKRVWRIRGTRFDENNINWHSKNTRQVFSFIVCFRGLGPIKQIKRLNSDSYIEYLEELLKYIEEEFDDGNCLILQDNHPVHNSRAVKNWINNNIGPFDDFVLPHPSLSPDLNPVENVGAMLKSEVKKDPLIFTSNNLWLALKAGYEELAKNKEYFINLIDSMPRRLQQVIQNNGGHTKY